MQSNNCSKRPTPQLKFDLDPRSEPSQSQDNSSSRLSPPPPPPTATTSHPFLHLAQRKKEKQVGGTNTSNRTTRNRSQLAALLSEHRLSNPPPHAAASNEFGIIKCQRNRNHAATRGKGRSKYQGSDGNENKMEMNMRGPKRNHCAKGERQQRAC